MRKLPKNNKIFMNIALEVAKMSKCVSFNVGCIIVNDGRILSIGYNGTPQGYLNCSEKFPKYDSTINRDEHHAFSLKYEIHAEMNALLHAAKIGISINESDMYVTHQPCEQCLKNILASGVKTIYYKYEYDKVSGDKELLKFAAESGISIIQIKD